jgi:hypothetical protein
MSNNEIRFFRIDGTNYDGMTRMPVWEPMGSFSTMDEAQLALADARAYPLDKSYRIMEVTERQVV